MTAAQTLQDVVSTATYKPGWGIGYRVMHGKPHIWIHALVPDSNDQSRIVEIDHILPMPPISSWADVHECRLWVHDQILAVERHEVGEWLRFGQDRPFLPPHGDQGDPYRGP